ncbi:MAG: RluA family pseudouridine synthase [Bacteroidota bacterium]
MKINFKDIILFENDDFIVVNKPHSVSTLDERNADDNPNSILRMAKVYSDDAQVAHRLDKETSGVLAIAKNPEAYRHLSMQFEHREVRKRYHAVVEGVHNFEDISVYLPILALRDGMVKIDRQQGKIAETIFNTLKVYKNHTLVECQPITGRMHQIRIHLTCLKAPIVSDELYGGSMLYLSSLKKKFNLKQDTEEQPIMKRVALHAHSLSFSLINGDPITIIAPYPKDLEVLIKQLDKNT